MTALEGCLDRTACLVPDVRIYVGGAAADVWVKPAHALYCEFMLVGGGSGGCATVGVSGGGGGGGGQVVREIMRAADLPSSLQVVAGSGGVGGLPGVDIGNGANVGAGGGLTYVTTDLSLSSSDFALIAQGALAPDTSAGGIPGYYAGETAPPRGLGGVGATIAGTSGGAGARGQGGGHGGLGGVENVSFAAGGHGYGAGGGGGMHSSGGPGRNFAGGGGGGGYGPGYYAEVITATQAGGAGAPGVVIITTWRGVAL